MLWQARGRKDSSFLTGVTTFPTSDRLLPLAKAPVVAMVFFLIVCFLDLVFHPSR